MPCDAHGNYLPPSTFPPPYMLPGNDNAAHNDWDPFDNRAQFEITNFLYRWNQMPGTQVDILFNLWAASGDNGTEPPFSSHNDLYETINAIKLGNLPWTCFTVKYNGPLLAREEHPPGWWQNMKCGVMMCAFWCVVNWLTRFWWQDWLFSTSEIWANW